MFLMPLEAFTQDETFPFYIHFGKHEDTVFLHGHDRYYELVIVLDGCALHNVDGEQYQIEKGDVFVIAPDTEHGYESPEDFRICNIMFRQSFLDLSAFDIAKEPGFQALFILEPQRSRDTGFTSHLTLNTPDFQSVGRMLHRLHDEYYGHAPGWKTMVKSLFLQLVVMLSRLYDTDKISQGAGIVKLATAIAHIEQHYPEEISTSELAGMTHYSERQFIRLFKEATGCTPHGYITRLRMQAARELLRHTDLPVTEIAGRCGYTDSNYFSKLFLRINGATPRGYRRN